MSPTGRLKVTTPTEREIAMTRVFDAPRSLVFEAYTKPELVKRWLGATRAGRWAVCEIDLRVGGSYRYVWRGPDGEEMGMRGVFREIVEPERIVSHRDLRPVLVPGRSRVDHSPGRTGRKTTLTMTVRYESQDGPRCRAQVAMEQGVAIGFDKLEELLASTSARKTAGPLTPQRLDGRDPPTMQRRGESERHAEDHPVPVVRRQSRGGDELLRLHLQELEGR